MVTRLYLCELASFVLNYVEHVISYYNEEQAMQTVRQLNLIRVCFLLIKIYL